MVAGFGLQYGASSLGQCWIGQILPLLRGWGVLREEETVGVYGSNSLTLFLSFSTPEFGG